MLNLYWPWLLLLIPLPLLVRRLLPAANASQPTLRAPLLARFVAQSERYASSGSANRSLLATLLLWLMWLMIVFACTRPMWVGDAVVLPAEARDLMLAVDLSGSMQEQDMQIEGNTANRLQVVKKVVGEFVERRQGDRLGLILFGSKAYLQTPLTFDRKTLNTLLQEAQIGFAGQETAIGDAIGIAVKRLQDRPSDQRVLILMTDGRNTTGVLDPMQGADVANKANVRIYTIGIGADTMQAGGIAGFFSRTVNPSRDLDESTLQEIAALTGGRYFRARNPQEMAQIYQEIDNLEPIEQEGETIRPTQSLFHYPLALAFLLSMLLVVIQRKQS